MMSKLTSVVLKKVLIGLLLMTLIGITGVVLYVRGVINEIKPTLTAMGVYAESGRAQIHPSQVEAEAYTDRTALMRYLSFAQSPEKVRDFRRQQSEAFEQAGSNIVFNESSELPPLVRNDCSRYNCFQHRVNFSGIAPALWRGLLGIEDYRFLDHAGVDPVSILRAIIVDIRSMRLVQGGSTLTQQLVKNLFLTNEKTFSRKLKEIIYALYIEHFYQKDQIITAYFNEVFWGTLQGIYIKGVDAAARAYFDKPSRDIGDYEAAILISLLKGPYFYHPIRHSDRLKVRVKTVFARLKELGLVSTQTTAWTEEQWQQWLNQIKNRDKETYIKTISLLGDEQSYLGDYEKYILMEGVFKFLKDFKQKQGKKDIAVKVLAMPVNCMGESCELRFEFYSKLERDLKSAIVKEKHQVGSVLKPIIYKIFLKHGKKLDDMVSTEEITLELKSGSWTPRDSKSEQEEITLLEALQKSKNRPLIRIAQELGFDVIEQELRPSIPNLMVPLREFPSQLLGSIELSLENLAQLYRNFTLETCQDIRSEQMDFEDTIYYHMAQADKTTIRGYVSDLIAKTMIFGKTGTSNNGNDNWYVASDGNMVVVIWTGIETRVEGEKIPLSGASSSFKIFQNFMVNRGKRLADIYCM